MKFTGVLTVHDDCTEFDFDFFDLNNTTPVKIPEKFACADSKVVIESKNFGKERRVGTQLNYQNTDCLSFLETLESKSIDSILIDPPYYRVVNDKWDNQWFTIEEYYKWCRLWISELSRVQRIVVPSGSLGSRCNLWVFFLILRNQVSHLDNKLSYIKVFKQLSGRTSSKLKMFPTATESIFYFHKESRDFIRDLIQSEMKRLGMKGKDVNGITW